ncbi:MAG TPA: ADP-ribosylglycohydrolase family protein [Luteolibacter sp.]|nr:ADP-ribosylglycohydrolase family protein [Luteolibacter sp.]
MSWESMVWGGLLGDAISLGPHWVYDPQEIADKIGRPEKFHDPISPYHPGKKAGDLTHYGDQVLVLLGYLTENKSFDLVSYAEAWKAFWENPATISCRDGATKTTLANLSAGLPPEKAGAPSHDLAGASIIAPLFRVRWADDAALLDACRKIVAFTHNDPDVIDAAEFFARTALAVSRGKTIAESLDASGLSLKDGNLARWFAAAKGSARSGEDDSSVLGEFGLSCNIDGGFSGACHLLLKYPEDPFTALVENAAAGGDSSSRGMPIGMIYGAAGLLGKLPAEWTTGLRCADAVEKFIAAQEA